MFIRTDENGKVWRVCDCAFDQVPLRGPHPQCPDCKGTGEIEDTPELREEIRAQERGVLRRLFDWFWR